MFIYHFMYLLNNFTFFIMNNLFEKSIIKLTKLYLLTLDY